MTTRLDLDALDFGQGGGRVTALTGLVTLAAACVARTAPSRRRRVVGGLSAGNA